MTEQNWLVNDEGRCEAWAEGPALEDGTPPYRLYRFLTELEDLLIEVGDNRQRLRGICPLVRKLLADSAWLQMMPGAPDPATGWEVSTLYDEPFFPLTVQLVVWAPGVKSSIHNHAAWGVVALLSGQEKNTFWRRSPTAKFPDKIQVAGEQVFDPGQILCLMPEAIHQVEALGDEPTVSFNVYGETDYDHRFEFDVDRHTAHIF
ncbi:MAG: cupin [Oscillatoriales cyanobacterium SM2_1_8]|nr:cupin [Oscillatoriales cyanobacterium SM2_1_8]